MASNDYENNVIEIKLLFCRFLFRNDNLNQKINKSFDWI